MFCQKCGKEIPDGAAFCGVCGTKAGENGVPQITYVVKEVKPKPILTKGERTLITVIGVVQIIRPAILLLLLFIIGWAAGIKTGSMDGFFLTGAILLPFILIIGAYLFVAIMILCKKRWALIVASVFYGISLLIWIVCFFTGNYAVIFDIIVCVVMLILIHKCQKALSKETQEQRRMAQSASFMTNSVGQSENSPFENEYR